MPNALTNPSFLPVSTSIGIHIPFHDIDAMEVVWHGHYAKYLEIARCALLDKLHYNYPDMRASGYAWPVIDMRIKYIRPLHFQQHITVDVAISEYEHRLRMDYVIRDTDTSERLCKAHTLQVAVDMSTRELCYVTPPIFHEKLAAYQALNP